MRTKNLFFILSAIALMSFAGVSQAAWLADGTDAITPLTGYDIDSVKFETIPTGDSTFPYTAKIGIKMAAGSELPGLIMVQMDLDNDVGTGGSFGMLAIPIGGACHLAPGNYIKTQAGFDIGFIIALRSQHPVAPSAVSNPWAGCVQKGAAAGYCPEGDCFLSSSVPCTMGSLIGTRCAGGVHAGNVCVNDDDCPGSTCSVIAHSGLCYDLTQPCVTINENCDNNDTDLTNDAYKMQNDNKCSIATPLESLRAGQWYAFSSLAASNRGVAPYYRGTDDLLVKITGNEACFTLPISKITEYAVSTIHNFDEDLADDSANWRYDISAWQNNAQDSDDFIIYNDAESRICLASSDVAPSTGRAVVDKLTTGYCVADTNNDGKVNLTDLGKLKGDFGNTKCPCNTK